MNPGTFYLYEYENKQRRRNVGFIKISRHYNSCIIQVRVRGIPAGNGASLPLYAFFRNESNITGKQIALLNCFSGNISARFPVSETLFPKGKPLSEIDGFLIRSSGKRSSLFWMASEFFFDADLSEMQTDDEIPPDQPASPVPETVSPDTPPPSDPDHPVATANAHENPPDKCKDVSQVRKISYAEINRLPSRLWPLANNSFLLHGYRNYGHLLLIRENGRFWLGVPGIYDSQESRVAELYGFPRFTRSYVEQAGLSEEERNDKADFGHWCRCTGPCSQNPDGHSF